MFHLVEFTDANDLAVVPATWFDGTSCCLWPSYKSSSRINTAVKQQEVPGPEWKSFPIRSMYSNASYERTRSKLAQAERESDLGTEDDENIVSSKRKRRSPERYSSPEREDSPERPPRKPKQHARQLQLPHLPSPPPRILPQLPSPQPRLMSQILAVPHTPPTSAVPRPHSSTPPAQRPRPQSTVPPPFSELTSTEAFLTLQHKILKELSEQRILLNQLCHQGVESATPTAIPDDMRFPLGTVGEVLSLETRLADREVFASVVNHLAVFGGRTVKELIGRVMKEIFTNSLAQLYNFHGKKGKHAFGPLNLATVLHKCLIRNSSTKSGTRKDVEVVVKEWLRGARDRDGGRNRRSSTTTQETALEQIPPISPTTQDMVRETSPPPQ